MTDTTDTFTTDALEILRLRAEKNSELMQEYLKEKRRLDRLVILRRRIGDADDMDSCSIREEGECVPKSIWRSMSNDPPPLNTTIVVLYLFCRNPHVEITKFEKQVPKTKAFWAHLPPS